MATSRMVAYQKETKDFLERISSNSQWTNLDGEVIMDIGCGSGENSTKFILERYPGVEKIIAFDRSPAAFAVERRYSNPQIEYHVANIQEKLTLRYWEGKISRIVCIHSLNFVDDQKTAFQNVFDMLVPGGEAAFRFTIRSGFYDAFAEIIEKEEWKPLLKDLEVIPLNNTKHLDAAHYVNILTEIGFIILECEEMHGSNSNRTVEDWKNTITSYSFIAAIPVGLQEAFKKDLFATFSKHNSRTSSGHLLMKYTTLEALIRKPRNDEF